jgi:hypothetical protein
MIGYRFKTEEEMIATFGPNWDSGVFGGPLSFKMDKRVLGLPLTPRFCEWMVSKCISLSITDKNPHVGVHSTEVEKISFNIFDIKDTVLAAELTRNIKDYKWGDKIGHPLLYDWFTAYYIDTETQAKISVAKNKKITFKLPEHANSNSDMAGVEHS